MVLRDVRDQDAEEDEAGEERLAEGFWGWEGIGGCSQGEGEVDIAWRGERFAAASRRRHCGDGGRASCLANKLYFYVM